MSKVLSRDPTELSEARQKVIDQFNEYLKSVDWSEGRINFNYLAAPETLKRRATLYLTEKAWQKISSLVNAFSKEVAWHGIARRGENDDYYIDDIVVYPQIVTAATVDTDDIAYATWLYSFDDDTFNHIRMQGHSHVNMSVTPSPTDTGYWSRLMRQVQEPDVQNRFYICMIVNKRSEKYIRIYDFDKGILFETADIDCQLIKEPDGIEQFLDDAKEKVKDYVAKPKTETKPPEPPKETGLTVLKGGAMVEHGDSGTEKGGKKNKKKRKARRRMGDRR